MGCHLAPWYLLLDSLPGSFLCRGRLAVTVIYEPYHSPYYAYRTKHIERETPSVASHKRYDDERSGSSTKACRSPYKALGLAHFLFLEPSADDTRRAWRRSCLAYTETETYGKHGEQARRKPCEASEQRPPQHNASKYPTVPGLVAKGTKR